MAPEPAPPRIPGADYVRHVGSGGFADVFLYRQHVPDRNVAIKVPRYTLDTDSSDAFRREVNLMARLSAHPAVLTVHGVGTCEDGRQYLVTEYCPPPSLVDRVRSRPLAVDDVLDKGIRLAGALASLHREGIIHRDVKPGNILLTELGLPVLTDFGLAASMSAGQHDGARGLSLPWSPPEQQRGNSVLDPTADVYSLGATLWTMLCGYSPFEVPGGDNSESALTMRILNVPAPRTGREDVPEELERVLARSMAKDPAARQSSAVEFARGLQQVQWDQSLPVTSFDVLEYGDGSASNGRGPTSFLVEPGSRGAAPAPLGRQYAETKVSRVILIDEAAAATAASPSLNFVPDQRRLEGQATLPLLRSRAESRGERARRRSVQRNLTTVVVGFLALVLAVGVVAGMAFRHLWQSAVPTDSPPAETTESGVLTNVPVPTVRSATGLSGTVGPDGVTFSWDSAGQGVSYLYRVVDPTEGRPVQETPKTSVIVAPVEGRTCLELVVRQEKGATSAPVVTCVVTP
ncbi:serine/threonine protein kinase [Schaalia sp. 19OD2882]|uniref:serine/threonine-protein kinase n=1 Tax=Schaalia sp. 19OD2882 TaxID=2794089 RepID=UPI001C1E93D3|nr:serine/threonine-protein kinase [Schaalia sp. 19OD2882]QWW19160.1 serine/threonine protein kinase [Schaalia sp. 19OD2882]